MLSGDCRGLSGYCRPTVGPLSGHCRATVGATVGCDGVRPPVRQSPNCRVVSELSESLSELSGYCRATVGLLSGPLLGLVTCGGSSVPFLIWDSLSPLWQKGFLFRVGPFVLLVVAVLLLLLSFAESCLLCVVSCLAEFV